MAYILKECYYKKSKGVIVFTHKEVIWGSDNINFLKMCKELSHHYIIGVHFGWYMRDVALPKYADFAMSSPSTATFKGNPFVIPLNSKYFIGNNFLKIKSVQKKYDLTCISHLGPGKNLKHMIDSISDSSKLYKNLIFNLVISHGSKEKVDDIKNYINKKMNPNNFILNTPEEGSSLYRLDSDDIVKILNESKNYITFSKKEGECRIIAEALMCGVPCIVYHKMRGGGLDCVDKEDLFLFEDDNPCLAINYALSNAKNVDSEKYFNRFSTSVNSTVLLNFIKKLFEIKKLNFIGNLIIDNNFSHSIAGHNKKVLWDSKNLLKTADIKNEFQIDIFYKYAIDNIIKMDEL